MAKLRFNMTMALDGYVAGPGQSLENPLGEGGSARRIEHRGIAARRSGTSVD